MKMKRILAALLSVAALIPISAKEQVREFLFDGKKFEIPANSSSASAPAVFDGAEWTLMCSKGTQSSGQDETEPGKDDAAQIFSLPKPDAYGSTTLQLRTTAFVGFKVMRVEIEAWTSLKVQTCVSVSEGLEDGYKATLLSGKIEYPFDDLYNNSYPFTNPNDKIMGDGSFLKISFVNKGTGGPKISKVYVHKIKVTYDDGQPEDPKEMTLGFSADGGAVESGAVLKKGSLLKAFVDEEVEATITYKIGDSTIDDLFPAEGLKLEKEGQYVYHFMASAEGYETLYQDFVFTVLGEITSADISARNFLDAGLTIFDSESEEFEVEKNYWKTNDVDFYFERGEKIRMEETEDGSAQLMLYPGATLSIGMSNHGHSIIDADIDGLNSDNLSISLQNTSEEKSPRKAAHWDSMGKTGAAMEVTNIGDQPAGISTVRLTVSKDTETITAPIFDREDTPAEYYDLSGKKVVAPAAGIYLERKGNSVRKIVVR